MHTLRVHARQQCTLTYRAHVTGSIIPGGRKYRYVHIQEPLHALWSISSASSGFNKVQRHFLYCACCKVRIMPCYFTCLATVHGTCQMWAEWLTCSASSVSSMSLLRQLASSLPQLRDTADTCAIMVRSCVGSLSQATIRVRRTNPSW